MMFRSHCIVAIMATATAMFAQAAAAEAEAVAQDTSSASGSGSNINISSSLRLRTGARATDHSVHPSSSSSIAHVSEDIGGATGKHLKQSNIYSESEDDFQLQLVQLAAESSKMTTLEHRMLEVEGLTEEDKASSSLSFTSTSGSTKIKFHGSPPDGIGRLSPSHSHADRHRGRELVSLTGDRTVVIVRAVTSCGQQPTTSEAALAQSFFADMMHPTLRLNTMLAHMANST